MCIYLPEHHGYMSAVTAQQAPEQQGVQRDVCAISPEALMLLTPDQVSRAALAHVVAHIHNWHQAWSSALQHAQALHTHTQMQDPTLLRGVALTIARRQWPGGMQLVTLSVHV